MALGWTTRLEIDEPFHVMILKYGSLPQLKLYSEIATKDMTIAYHLVVPIMGTLPSDVVRSLLREATNGYSPVGLPRMAWHASCSRCGTVSFPYVIMGHPIDFRWCADWSYQPVSSLCWPFTRMSSFISLVHPKWFRAMLSDMQLHFLRTTFVRDHFSPLKPRWRKNDYSSYVCSELSSWNDGPERGLLSSSSIIT